MLDKTLLGPGVIGLTIGDRHTCSVLPYLTRLLRLSPDSLVALWELNGDANDSSGNGYHATGSNVLYTVAGPSGGKAAVFNGTNALITLPVSLNSHVNFDKLSLLSWFWADSAKWASADWATIISIGEDFGNIYQLTKLDSANTLAGYARRGSATVFVGSVVNANLHSSWHCITMTINKAANESKAYLDGTLFATGTVAGTYTGGVNSFRQIGAWNSARLWKGYIGPTALWSDKILSASEVKRASIL